MTAKPESVESLCAEFMATSGCECGNGVEPCRLCQLDGKVSRILTAHRAELAEALKAPTREDWDALREAGEDYYIDSIKFVLRERRRKHGVGE